MTNTPARTVFILFRKGNRRNLPPFSWPARMLSQLLSVPSPGRHIFPAARISPYRGELFPQGVCLPCQLVGTHGGFINRFSHSAIFLLFSPIVLLFSFSCSSSLFHCLPPAFPVAIKSVIAFFISLCYPGAPCSFLKDYHVPSAHQAFQG